MLIPPSALAVILASIGGISVGGLLMAGVIPGVLLGAFFAAYIILRAWLNPSCAPNYPVPLTPFGEKVMLTVKRLLPIGFIIFSVIGVIVLGLATPTEAAASGTIATFIVTLIYRCFNWQVLKASLKGSIEIWVMVFMIIGSVLHLQHDPGLHRGIQGAPGSHRKPHPSPHDDPDPDAADRRVSWAVSWTGSPS